MANELDVVRSHLPITLQFELANPGAGATTDMALAQAGTGFVVPTGYKFHPIMICGVSSADLTAGTADYKVTTDGTELVNGPTVQLADTVQRATGLQRVGVEPIAAGAVVGVSITTSAGYLPTTADHDCMLTGVLTPA